MKRTILVGADPIGKSLKDEVVKFLIKEDYEVVDIGSNEEHDVDYYDVGKLVGNKISKGEFKRAIIFCGTGMGVNIVANKFSGVYCGLCESVMTAKLCRIINNCNVLSLGAITTTPFKAIEMVDAFLNTSFASDCTVADPVFLKVALQEVKRIEEELYQPCSTL